MRTHPTIVREFVELTVVQKNQRLGSNLRLMWILRTWHGIELNGFDDLGSITALQVIAFHQ
jgi:hypothetical protein